MAIANTHVALIYNISDKWLLLYVVGTTVLFNILYFMLDSNNDLDFA